MEGGIVSPRHSAAIGYLREKLGDLIPIKYNTDFNLLRWIINAENLHGVKGSLELAEKQLRNHLRFRKAMKLDDIKIPSMENNPMYKEKKLPRGSVTLMESQNRFLYWTDYETMDITGVVKCTTTSELLHCHFLLYEELLRIVNERERETGRMSGIDVIIDMAQYAINPIALVIVNNGQLSYYITVFHYEHYPQLVFPIWTINIPKWVYLPYRMTKALLPKDVNEKIRLLDANYKITFQKMYDPNELPESLGGNLKDEHLLTVPAHRFTPDEYYKPSDDDPTHQDCTHIQIGARRRKFVHFEIPHGDVEMKFFFRSDCDFVFGLIYDQDGNNKKSSKHHKVSDVDIDKMEMILPPIRLGAKHVPERGTVCLDEPGSYYIIFCNKASWLFRCNVYYHLEFDDKIACRVVRRTFSD